MTASVISADRPGSRVSSQLVAKREPLTVIVAAIAPQPASPSRNNRLP